MKDFKIESIAEDILRLSRNTLLVNLRFLDVAVNQLKWEIRQQPQIRTNGETVYYNPIVIARNFKECREKPNRDYLHILLHCIYRHMFISSRVDHRLWDLSCDIAVENIISELDIKSLDIPQSNKQKECITELKDVCHIITAEKLYSHFMNSNLSEVDIVRLSQLFYVDEHDIWYLTDESENSERRMQQGTDSNSQTNPHGCVPTKSIATEWQKRWKEISERMQSDILHFSNGRYGDAGSIVQNLNEVNRERYDYSEFLKKFAVLGEKTKINDEEFDYIFYTYGLQLYKNMPLIEPLEYKDVKQIKEFVIAIDTSGSVIGDLVQSFVQKTYNILKNEESFFTKINLHIIQCDTEIQSDVKITNQSEFDTYIKNMQLQGFGGNNEVRLFEYVDQLIKDKEFVNLKGMIYLTDGYGIFPSKKPEYEVAFVFVNDRYEIPEVPPWVIKLVLEKEDIMKEGNDPSEY